MSCSIYPIVLNNKGEKIPSPLFTDLSKKYSRTTAKEVYEIIHSDRFISLFGNWKDNKLSNTYPDSGEPMLFEGFFLLPDGEKLYLDGGTEFRGDLDRNIEVGKKLVDTFKASGVNVDLVMNSEIKFKGQVKSENGLVRIEYNPNLMDKSTLPHEFSHVYVDLLGYSHPLVKKGIAQAKIAKPDLWKNIQESYKEDYNGSVVELEKELLVTVMGDFIFDDSVSNPSWVNKILRFISEMLGIHKDAAKSLFKDMMSQDLRTFSQEIVDKESTSFQKDTISESKRLSKEIQEVVDEEIIAIQNRLKYFQSLKVEGKENNKSEKGILETTNLLLALKGKEAKESFVVLVEKGIEDLSRVNTWLSDTTQFETPKDTTAQHLVFAKKYLETYKKLDRQSFAEDDQKTSQLISNLNKELGDTARLVPERMKDYFTKVIKEDTLDPNYTDEDKIRNHLEVTRDLTGLTKYTGAMALSEDKILAIIDKNYKKRLNKVVERSNKLKSALYSKVKELKSGNVAGFDWMINKDTATFVQRQSGKYNDALAKLYSKLKDREGNMMEYIVKSYEDLTEEESNYNLELFKKKNARSTFLRSEEVNFKKRSIEDGVNKKYTDDFKAVRNQYEVFDWETFEYVKKAGVPVDVYNNYLAKYYNEPVEYYTLDIKNTGSEPVLREGRFVKDIHTEITDKWNDSRWESIQAHPAKKAFYDFYMNEMSRALSKLPVNTSNSMNGRLPAISKHFIDILYQSEGKISLLKKNLKNTLTPDYVLSHREVDENGNLMDSIPITFTNSLKSQEKLLEYQTEIANIETKIKEAKTIKEKDALTKERRGIKRNIRVEERKLSPSEVSNDLESSLIAFVDMSENFEVMSAFDSTVKIAKDLAENRQYYKVDSKGDIEMENGEPVLAKEGSKVPLAVDRLNDWMRMILYDNVEDNNTVVAQIAKKMMNYVSIKNLGLNVFSGINNAIIGDITQRIEAWGGEFYNRKDYRKSSKEFAGYLSTYFLKERSYLGDEGSYGEAKPQHKISAFMHSWDILQDQNQYEKQGIGNRTGMQKVFDADFMFAFTNIGEYCNQARSAMALMRNTEIKNSDGSMSNMWDAHKFSDGKFVLREGFSISEKDKFDLQNKIIGLNQYLHGRYTKEDQAALQKHFLGKMLYHFKKWVVPGIEARYKKRYFDERLSMEMEGRYRTLLPFLQSALRLRMDFKDRWNELDAMQKANMRKNAAELSYATASMAALILFSSLAGEVDDDDELLKKAANFLVYQSGRQVTELTTFVVPTEAYNQAKNPTATLGMVKESGDFLLALAKIPYNYTTGQEDKNYYERGVYKDDWKIKKETFDLIPLLTLVNKFKRLEEEQDYYK